MERSIDNSRVILGRELNVSRLGFGTLHLTEGRGFGEARSNAVELLQRAVDLGVDFFDTADSYGSGTTESVVRTALHPYDGITIATKGGYEHPIEGVWIPNGRPEHLRAAVEGSLKRLALWTIPVYFLHTPDPNVPYEESIGALQQLREEGKIRFVGICNVDRHHVRCAREILGDGLVAIQNYYNVMFHHGASNYFPDTEEILNECERNEWAFVAWEPLGTGINLPGVDDDSLVRREARDRLAEFAANHSLSPHATRLAALLSRSKQLIAIPGTSNLEHLIENMLAIPFSGDDSAFWSAWSHYRKLVTSMRRLAEMDALMRKLDKTAPTNPAPKPPQWEPRA